MDKVKYRIWDRENNQFYQPVYEAYKGNLEELLLDQSGDLSMRTAWGQMAHESTFPDRFVVDLFTSVRDKDNYPIFKNDIVHCSYTFVENKPSFKGIVEWDKYRFTIKNLDYETQPKFDFTPYVNLDPFGMDIEVIGNVYENPDLVKI